MIDSDRDTFTLPGIANKRLSRVAFGGHPIGGHGWGRERDDSSAIRALEVAIDSGFTFFDTADVYGLGVSEELHGRLLRIRPELRDRIVVATKGGVAWDEQGRTRRDSSPRHLRHAIEGSLRRLGVESIDLYYLHWPDGVTPLQESVEELVRFRQEGKIRTIGLSNVSPSDLRASEWARVSALQVKGSLLELDDLFQAAVAAHDIGAATVCYASLADGLLTGSIARGQLFGGDDHRSRYPLFQPGAFEEALERVDIVVAIADELGRTPAQVALRWLLDTGAVDSALCGSGKPSHVADNAGALGWTLPEEALVELGTRVPMVTSDEFGRWLVTGALGGETSPEQKTMLESQRFINRMTGNDPPTQQDPQ